MKNIDLIKPNDYYSLKMIFNLKVFDWIKTYDSLKRLVLNDIKKEGKNFKTIIHGKGTGKRYLIKGSTLISLVNKTKKGYNFK